MPLKTRKPTITNSPLITSSKTVFVKNLPTDCTDNELVEVFSKFGEVVKCFSVGKRKKQDKQKYENNEKNDAKYAFVTFSSEDGVKSVLSRKVVRLKQNKLICLAAKRRVRQRIKSKQSKASDPSTKSERIDSTSSSDSDSDSDSGDDSEESEILQDSKAAVKEIKHSNVQSRSLVLSGLPLLTPTSQAEGDGKHRDMIQRLVSQFIPGLESVEPLPQLENTLLLTFSSKNLSRKAMTLLNNLSWGDGHLQVKLASLALLETSARHQKKSKLLIRNLSFKCNLEDLRKSFEKFGNVVEVHIPQKPGTDQMLGFGFVTMGNIFEASLAIRKMNGCEIKGRKVAVDWALDRKVYQSKKQQNAPLASNASLRSENNHAIDSESDDSVVSSEEDKSEVSSESVDSNSGSVTQPSDLRPLSSSGNKVKPRRDDSTDGKCLFLRNLPFSLDEEELESFFTEEFGPIQYAKLVTNRETGMLTGNGFVRFRDHSIADECLQRSEDGLTIEGRTVEVMKAVTKVEAGNFSETRKKKNQNKEDKRNLGMSHIGSVDPESEEFQALSKADKDKRMRAEAEKLEKLKNPNIFVSRDRLSIRNLALSMSDKELKALCAKHTPKGGKVKSARIMRDLDKLKDGVGKSRGFGFVEFSSHEATMSVLTSLNNNPDVLSNNRRLIVEFSLENQRAVKAKEIRLEKSKLKLQQLREEGETGSVPKQNDKFSKVKSKRFGKVLDKRNRTKPSHKLEKDKQNKSTSKRTENAKFRNSSREISRDKSTNKPEKQAFQRSERRAKFKQTPTPSRRERKRKTGEREERDERRFEELIRQYQKKLFRVNPN